METTDFPLQRRADKVKYLYHAPSSNFGEMDYVPYFYAEVRIDFNDVRTGFRETFSLNKVMEIHSPCADFLWAKDMVQDVDPQNIAASVPEGVRFSRLPDFVDTSFISQMEIQFIQYLLRSFTTELYRNTALNVYSNSAESRFEFIWRCMELLDGSMGTELDRLQDVFIRRLEQLKEKFLASGESTGLEQASTESRNKNVFSRYFDRIAELFMVSRSLSGRAIEPFPISPGMLELEERLAALGNEAQNAVTSLTKSFQDRACAIDTYILHPNLKDIHFVRSCILWMPKRAV
jgi:hypothetical protein